MKQKQSFSSNLVKTWKEGSKIQHFQINQTEKEDRNSIIHMQLNFFTLLGILSNTWSAMLYKHFYEISQHHTLTHTLFQQYLR